MFLIVLIVCIILSALSKAIMDTVSYGTKFRTISNWWNPEVSWKLKWKNGDPKNGEKFLGSSTIFVSFTDAWHFFQHFFLFFLFIGFIIYPYCFIFQFGWETLLHFIILYSGFTFNFQIIYWLLNKK